MRVLLLWFFLAIYTHLQGDENDDRDDAHAEIVKVGLVDLAVDARKDGDKLLAVDAR